MTEPNTPQTEGAPQTDAQDQVQPTPAGLPMALIGAMLSALKDECGCRSCQVLRAQADQLADVLTAFTVPVPS